MADSAQAAAMAQADVPAAAELAPPHFAMDHGEDDEENEDFLPGRMARVRHYFLLPSDIWLLYHRFLAWGRVCRGFFLQRIRSNLIWTYSLMFFH